MHGFKRLYYFTSVDIAERILKERRLKISLFKDVNDPFELMYVSVEEKNMRRIAKVLRQHFEKNKGLICFSDNWRSPVMWAHYAQKHTGVCLGFDITENPDILQPVQYKPERLKRRLRYDDKHLGLDVQFLQQLLVTKAIEWSYECEYRVFSNILYKDAATGFYFQNFGDEIRLREVIVGERNKSTFAYYKKLVGEPEYPVKIIKARAAFTEFAMVENKAYTPVRVKAAKGR